MSSASRTTIAETLLAIWRGLRLSVTSASMVWYKGVCGNSSSPGSPPFPGIPSDLRRIKEEQIFKKYLFLQGSKPLSPTSDL